MTKELKDPITLFTPYFAARTAERQRELDLCLQRNLDCAHLERVVLLVDDGHKPPLQHAKLTVLDVPTRPTYADWVRLGRELSVQGISLLANTDIYFDESLPAVREALRSPRAFLALSRYELLGESLEPHPQPHWSQDVWGLRADAELHDSLLRALTVPLGVPRCDNKVAYLFAIHGWSVHNPQPVLRSVHVHETQQRHYDKTADLTVLGSVAYVHPVPAAHQASRVDIDVWALNTPAIGSVKLNRSLDQWAAERAAKLRAPPGVQTAAIDADAPGEVPSEQAAVPAEIAAAPAQPPMLAEWVDFASRGRRRWSHALRFDLLELDGRCMALDWLTPDRGVLVPAQSVSEPPAATDLLRLFVPPLLATDPIAVADRPRDAHDLNFWQYPAATERQARDNHCDIALGANQDAAMHEVHTYLALPWATYIDKKASPEEALRSLATRVAGLQAMVRSMGWRLRVHTVCQQIHWHRLIATFITCGVSDLHLSHATDDIDPAQEGWPLRIRSWPLIAPNVEDPGRRVGLVFGKPPGQRRWLASFIGAHMQHYRSDARLRLAEVARACGRSDVLVEVTDLWHFNQVVYKEQVAGKALAEAERAAHLAAMRRYNEVLSDSIFSLCPEGAGPNTLRVWESLAVGAIPVIVAPGWVPPAATPGQPDLRECCVFLNPEDLPLLLPRLEAIKPEQRAALQAAGLAAYAQLKCRRTFGGGQAPWQ